MTTTDLDLNLLVSDFAWGLVMADSKRPVASSMRSKAQFKAGIGPHTEAQTIDLVTAELKQACPERYGAFSTGVSYPDAARQKCDLCIGCAPDWQWVAEVKMLRLLGDNGKLNDNMLMHILSPYPEHRSALTDCDKLIRSGFHGRKAVVIYGFECARSPLEPAIQAFEILAHHHFELSERSSAHFSGLVHPVHREGRVFGWEVRGMRSSSD